MKIKGILAFILLILGFFILFSDENKVIEIIPHELNKYGQELLINSEPDIYYTLPVGTYEVSITSEKYNECVNIYDENDNYDVIAGPLVIYPNGEIEVTIKEGYVVGFGATSIENPTIIFEKVS